MGQKIKNMYPQDNQQMTGGLNVEQKNQQNEGTIKREENNNKEGKGCWARFTKWVKKWGKWENGKWVLHIFMLVLCFIIVFRCINNNNLVSWTSEPNLSTTTLPIIYRLLISLTLFGFICLILYYYDNDKINTQKKQGMDLRKTGYDITLLFTWLFSADGLFAILTGAILVLIAFFVHNFSNKNDNQLQLAALTLTISLSALIPSLISRIVAKNQLNDIIEEKLEKELNKFKTSLDSIRKDKGHSCRMSAALLYQIAHNSNDNEEKRTNAIWSIGWAAQAIIQYLLIMDKYPHATKRIEECGNKYIKGANEILSDFKVIHIKNEDLISVITMYALNKHFCLGDTIGEADIKKIAEKFYSYRDKKRDISGASCRITGMDDEFNRTLESEADEIIRGFSKKIEHI